MIQKSKQVQELNSYYFVCSQIFINIYPGCIIEEKITYTGNNINIGGREKWQGTKVSLCQAEFILTPSSSPLLRSSSSSIEVKTSRWKITPLVLNWVSRCQTPPFGLTSPPKVRVGSRPLILGGNHIKSRYLETVIAERLVSLSSAWNILYSTNP